MLSEVSQVGPGYNFSFSLLLSDINYKQLEAIYLQGRQPGSPFLGGVYCCCRCYDYYLLLESCALADDDDDWKKFLREDSAFFRGRGRVKRLSHTVLSAESLYFSSLPPLPMAGK